MFLDINKSIFYLKKYFIVWVGRYQHVFLDVV